MTTQEREHKQKENKQMKELNAWVNRMPGSTPILHVRNGKDITAPTPCYKAIGTHQPDVDEEPGVYQILVELVATGDICPQVVTDVPFEPYWEVNYQGNHGKAKLTYPDGTTDETVIKTRW